MSTFSKILKELRAERDTPQHELAKICGVTRTGISYYETEKAEPNIKTLIKIANYFDVSLDYLCGKTTDINFKDEYQNNLSKKEWQLLKDFRAVPEQYQKLCLSYIETIKNEFAKTNEGDLING